MDPLTHALTGATLAWAATGTHLGRRSLLIGAAAGLLPDLDVLIRSAADPLLAIEHHRGFTHSLLFVPIGGLIAALPFAARLRGNHLRRAALAGILAYASHPLLDAATTYGTQLFLPFSKYRVGLDIISIIDPIFTLFVLAGVIAAFAARRRIAVAALIATIAWLAIGFVQRERASTAQSRFASARGDRVSRRAVFPTIGNTMVWRSIYETNGALRIDRIRTPWFRAADYASVTAVPLVTLDTVARDERTRRDFHRFAWFSDGWLARAPSDPTVIGDARYTLRSATYDPVWGIRFRRGANPPTEWVNRTREREVDLGKLWSEIRGTDVAFQRVP